MRTTRIRKLAENGGLVGLLVASAYVAGRMVWSSKRARLAAAAFAGLGLYLTFQQPEFQGRRFSQPTGVLPVSASVEYDILPLATLGAGEIATGINAGGDVSGVALVGEDSIHAVTWQGGKVRDLGTLGGEWSWAAGINDQGVVAGQGDGSQRELRGFLWNSGKMTPLNPLDGLLSVAAGINGRGDAIGTSSENKERFVACVWKNGKPLPLALPSGYEHGIGAGLNDSGNAAGYCASAQEDRVRAALWSDGRVRELGTLGGESSFASAINSSGLVVGASAIAGDESWHACVWDDGKARDVGVLPDMTWAIVKSVNQAGDLVGASGVG
jgi:probable HAF family extracellular repeat protein